MATVVFNPAVRLRCMVVDRINSEISSGIDPPWIRPGDLAPGMLERNNKNQPLQNLHQGIRTLYLLWKQTRSIAPLSLGQETRSLGRLMSSNCCGTSRSRLYTLIHALRHRPHHSSHPCFHTSKRNPSSSLIINQPITPT